MSTGRCKGWFGSKSRSPVYRALQTRCSPSASSKGSPLRRRAPLQAEAVAGSVGKILPDAQVAFGGLDGGVAERELDLLEGGVAFVGELGEGTAQVIGERVESRCARRTRLGVQGRKPKFFTLRQLRGDKCFISNERSWSKTPAERSCKLLKVFTGVKNSRFRPWTPASEQRASSRFLDRSVSLPAWAASGPR